MRRTGTTTRSLGPQTVRSWAARAERWLAEHRDELDAMNVFPVADSDTGTNLYLTFADAAAAVSTLPDDASSTQVATAWARGALVGARGNSGVIAGAYVGELLRGLLDGALTDGAPDESAGGDVAVSPSLLVAALTGAADAARRAVGDPVEGTVLTVVRSVGDAAVAVHGAGTTPDPLAVLDEAITRGYTALARTTEQLAPLRAAGVLDAGAWGLLLVLDALSDALGSPTAAARAAGHPTPRLTDAERPPDRSAHAHGGGEFEVMYLVSAPDGGSVADVAAAVRAGLAGVGESVAVVGGDGLWQAHVHTDRPLEAMAVPSSLGLRTEQVRARHLLPRRASGGPGGLGLVAVTEAPGLVADLTRAGAAVVLVTDGPVGPELARAVDDTGAPQVLVLASALVGAAQRAGVDVRDGLTEVQVVAGAATFATLDPLQDAAGGLAEVRDVVERVRSVHVALPEAGRVPDVGASGQTEAVLTVARELLGEGGALLTVVTGGDTPPEVVAGLRSGLAGTHPAAEMVVLDGQKAGSDVVLGVG